MNKVTPFLMFNDQLEAAIEFYTATFPNSEVINVARTGENGPISSAEFVVGGQLFMGYNGGAYFSFSEGVSLYVDCADQDEVDEYWGQAREGGCEAHGMRLDQGPLRSLLANSAETIHRADPRSRSEEGEGRNGRHDDDGEARCG
jgi:uncharacterized glyoxalase superfamily protein PhnB